MDKSLLKIHCESHILGLPSHTDGAEITRSLEIPLDKSIRHQQKLKQAWWGTAGEILFYQFYQGGYHVSHLTLLLKFQQALVIGIV